MNTFVIGTGLVSPAGMSPQDHAFFVAPTAFDPCPSPFAGPDQERIDVNYCPWIGARLSFPERLYMMAQAALQQACAGLDASLSKLLYCVLPSPRPGWTKQDAQSLGQTLARQCGASGVHYYWGDAGAFEALKAASEALNAAECRVALLAAVDSNVSCEALTDYLQHRPTIWQMEGLTPSEAAAAIALSGQSKSPLANLNGIYTGKEEPNDFNDEPVQGLALTSALRSLPACPAIWMDFGQHKVNSLRYREWSMAVARNVSRFGPILDSISVERSIGRVGAAAGLFNLVYGLSVLAHDTQERAEAQKRPFIAWAISPEGTRGLALLTVEKLSPLQASRFTPKVRKLAWDFPPSLPPTPPELLEDLPPEDDHAPSTAPTEDLSSSWTAPPMPEEPRPEPEPFEPQKANPPSVLLLETGGEPIEPSQFYAGIVNKCVELIAMLARHRTERPQEERAETEERLLDLTDAVTSIGPNAGSWVLEAWQSLQQSSNPWTIWAPVFLLGQSVSAHVFQTISQLIETLEPKTLERAQILADALSLSPHPEMQSWAQMQLASPEPIFRSVCTLWLAEKAALSTEQLLALMGDSSPIVQACALRAASESDSPSERMIFAAKKALQSQEPQVAWEAARTLTLWKDPSPYQQLRSSEALRKTLGLWAGELLVLTGKAQDLPLLEEIIRPSPPSPWHLSIVARFGSPLSWAYLLFALQNEELCQEAANALELLFGQRLSPKQRLSVSAWRAWIASAKLDPELRYRKGIPWHPDLLVQECKDGALNRYETEQRLDELSARLAKRYKVPLGQWWTLALPALENALKTVGAQARGERAGRWF